MRTSLWLSRLSRQSLLVLLLALATYLTVRTELSDEDTFEKESPVTEVVSRGPTEVEDVEWRLDSLKVYTRLLDEKKEEVDVDVPDGAVIVFAILTVKPTERTKLDDGFTCNADLIDDRGNVWEAEDVFGIDLPTYCGDDDINVQRGKPFKIAKVFVIPKTAVPHVTGLVTPETGNTSAERRVLLTP
jgi:hypothetical protein